MMIYAYFCANLFGGMFKKTRSNRKELETGFERITGAFPVTFLAPRATSRTKEGSKRVKSIQSRVPLDHSVVMVTAYKHKCGLPLS